MTIEDNSLTVPFLKGRNETTVVELEIVEVGDTFIVRMKGVSYTYCGDPFFCYSVPIPNHMIIGLRDALADLLYRDQPMSWSSPDPPFHLEIPVRFALSDTFEPLIRLSEISSLNRSSIKLEPRPLFDSNLLNNVDFGIDVFISEYETSRESLDQIREFLSARLLYL